MLRYAVKFEQYSRVTAKADDVELPIIADFMPAKSKEAFPDKKVQVLGPPSILFLIDKNGLLVSQPRLNGTIQK